MFIQFNRNAGRQPDAAAGQARRYRHGLRAHGEAIQGVDSNYRTDLFAPIIERLAEFIGHDPETVESERFSYQVVADHSRAMTFLLAEGVTPRTRAPATSCAGSCAAPYDTGACSGSKVRSSARPARS